MAAVIDKTRGNLVFIRTSGKEEIVVHNKTWIELGREKRRLELNFPGLYGNKKIGRLKLKYIRK